ncbi:DUF2161 family putative PD-(D/E)XK-type phosphodiesterase [Dankookia sp. P2]|uniref:DUF2161 family putative PD-(D/E)XK-type phosphodiesterase n=1 Tax=Dankookia sp. P2 TaxID=3423955 RepID=UPI003D66B50B
MLSEHQRRRGDPAVGGSSRQPVMTAYRQRVLDCAGALCAGPKRPRDLREVAPDAAAILLRNVYGWFEREARGVYRLSPAGSAGLLRWATAEASSRVNAAHSSSAEAAILAAPVAAAGS